jgi:hypothetical protein
VKKIVINRCHGGFGLSDQAKALLGLDANSREPARDDPSLVSLVERDSVAASDSLACLVVVEIPDDVEWQIEEYDGLEWVAEKHRTWP